MEKYKFGFNKNTILEHHAMFKSYREVLKAYNTKTAKVDPAKKNILESLVGINMKNEITGVDSNIGHLERMRIFDKLFRR